MNKYLKKLVKKIKVTINSLKSSPKKPKRKKTKPKPKKSNLKNKIFSKKETFKHINNIKLKKYILEKIPFQNHGLLNKGVSSYNSNVDYDQFDGVFLPYIYKFCSMAGRDYRILDFWINIVEPGGHTKLHNHITMFEALKNIPQKVGAYYLQKPKNSGNLCMENNAYRNKHSSEFKVIKVKENDMIIFDPFLNHYTEINKSKKQRIVFAVNLAEKVRKDFDQDGNVVFLQEYQDTLKQL